MSKCTAKWNEVTVNVLVNTDVNEWEIFVYAYLSSVIHQNATEIYQMIRILQIHLFRNVLAKENYIPLYAYMYY